MTKPTIAATFALVTAFMLVSAVAHGSVADVADNKVAAAHQN